MEYIIICFASLIGAGITLFSGFGLGTILLPVFGLFFPIEIAIVLTSIVHFSNNILKFFLFKKDINIKILFQFGIPALISAFVGAYLLTLISNENYWFSYIIFNKIFEITFLKITIGTLLIMFSLFEFIPKLKNVSFNKKYLPLGGILSGFFGGISGHQGALRSAFLIKAELSKAEFIATGVAIACFVDISRMSIYFPKIVQNQFVLDYKLLICATISAFIGVYFGNKLLQKTTIPILQNIVCVTLLAFGLLMIIGVI